MEDSFINSEKPELSLEELMHNFPRAVELKNQGNEFFSKKDYDNAIEHYTKAKNYIQELEHKINLECGPNDPNTINDGVKFLRENLKRENISIHSNLALCYSKKEMYQESIDHDSKIVTSFDPLFDKSYIRLVQNYLKLDKLDNAIWYYHLCKRQFKKETLSKYNDIIIQLQTDYPKFKQFIINSKRPDISHKGKFSLMTYITLVGVILIIAFYYYSFYYHQKHEEEF